MTRTYSITKTSQGQRNYNFVEGSFVYHSHGYNFVEGSIVYHRHER